MSFLHDLFSSPQSVQNHAAATQADVEKYWQQYLATVSEREKLLNRIHGIANIQIADLGAYKRALQFVVIDMEHETADYSSLSADMLALAHQSKIAKTQALSRTLGYVQTKYKYVNELLRTIYAAIKDQLKIINTMLDNSKQQAAHPTQTLAHEFAVEKEALSQIGEMQTFPNLFTTIVRGDEILFELSRTEALLAKKFRAEFNDSFYGKKEQATCFYLIRAVFKEIADLVDEAVAKDALEQHPDADAEIVNRPEFEQKVAQIMARDTQMLSIQFREPFIHVFREWYNELDDAGKAIFMQALK